MLKELSQGKASLAILIAAVLWGLYWIPIRDFAAAGIDGPFAVALLNGPPALVTGLWMFITWKSQRPHIANALAIGALAGTGFAFYGIAILETSVVRATLLFYLMPVWATFIGIFWLGETATWNRWVAVAMGVGGLFLLMIGDAQGGLNIGDVLAFVSGWSWAFAAAMIKRAGQIPVSGMLTVQFFFGSAIALLVGAMLGPIALPDLGAAGGTVAFAVAISIFVVLPAIVMIFWASQFLFPGRVGLLLMAEVVVAVVSASLLLPHEMLQPLQWGAVVLVIGAAFVELI